MTVSRYTQLTAQTVGLCCLLWRHCGQLKMTLGPIPEMTEAVYDLFVTCVQCGDSLKKILAL